MDRFLSNAIGDELYLTIPRLNHAQECNATIEWSEPNEKETVRAKRSIKKGEEITICYSCHHCLGAFNKNFICNCEGCSAPDGNEFDGGSSVRSASQRRGLCHCKCSEQELSLTAEAEEAWKETKKNGKRSGKRTIA